LFDNIATFFLLLLLLPLCDMFLGAKLAKLIRKFYRGKKDNASEQVRIPGIHQNKVGPFFFLYSFFYWEPHRLPAKIANVCYLLVALVAIVSCDLSHYVQAEKKDSFVHLVFPKPDPLTNDFAFLFWILFVLSKIKWGDQGLRNNAVNDAYREASDADELETLNGPIAVLGQGKPMANGWYWTYTILGSISLYLFVSCNMLEEVTDDLKNVWICFLFATNFFFDIWALTFFERPRQNGIRSNV